MEPWFTVTQIDAQTHIISFIMEVELLIMETGQSGYRRNIVTLEE